MDVANVLVIVLVIAALGAALFFAIKSSITQAQSRQLSELASQLSTIQQSVQQMVSASGSELRTEVAENLALVQKNLNEQLSQTRGNIGQELARSNEALTSLGRQLGELGETARNIQELGKDIKGLQDILQAPKLRGNLGELFLGDMLSQMLPRDNFELQYSFKSGEKVDAVIRLGEEIIPIDSKFPLESFRRMIAAENEAEKKKARTELIRSVKQRVDEIAQKYIRPEERTFEFALMYIPAENVYYEIIARGDDEEMHNEILTYALTKHVIPVSPNSFYAYLMAIGHGLKGFAIEAQAKEIRSRIGELQTELGKFNEGFQAVGKNVRIAHEKFGQADRRLGKINDRLGQITNVRMELDGPDEDATVALDAPTEHPHESESKE